jgi:hypothetical protein
MTKQLTLIDTPSDWQIDDRTREVGRRGIAAARAALRLARGIDRSVDHDRVDIVDPAA